VTRRLTPSKTAEGCEVRGDSKLYRRRSREMQEPGRPGNSSTGATGGVKIRGDPGIYVQKRWRMRNSRRLEDPSPAESEDAARGATRSCIGRRDWKSRAARFERRTSRRMRDSGQLEAPSRAQPQRCRIRGNPEKQLKAERVDAWSEEKGWPPNT